MKTANLNTVKAEIKKQLNLNLVEVIERKAFKVGVETLRIKIKSEAGNILERTIFKTSDWNTNKENGIVLEIL